MLVFLRYSKIHLLFVAGHINVRVELVVQIPARGSTQGFLCLFPGVLWLWHFLYSVGPHPVSSLHIHVYTFVVSRAFMAGAASQAGDTDSSRAPGLTSESQRSVNVYRGALLLVPQSRCISSFVFYIVKPGADPGIFVRGGPTFRSKKKKKKKKKKKGGGQRAGVVVVLSILQKYALNRLSRHLFLHKFIFGGAWPFVQLKAPLYTNI